MGIFEHHKTIVALFDNDQDLEQATQALQARGLVPDDSDQFIVIDSPEMTEEPRVAVPAAVPGGTGVVGVPVILDPVHDPDDDRGGFDQDTQTLLTDKGVEEEVAAYYTQRVRHGGKVLVLEVEDDDASEVVHLIEPMSTQVTVA